MKFSQLSLLGCATLAAASPMSFTHKKRNETSKPEMYQLSADNSFHFEILRAMSATTGEGADIGELLIASAQIKPDDFESYYNAMYNLAERIHAKSENIDASRFPVSARQSLWREAGYYRMADFYLHGNWSDPRINNLWEKQRAAFDKAIALMPIPGERVEIQGKGYTIPAIFYPAATDDEKRPTMIIHSGFDGSQEEILHGLGMGCLQRGFNVLTYEGPGQPTPRREQSIGFIPNWEEVVTPVVDYALSRSEVDPEAIGLIGMSFGGLLAPRAAAYEHRLAAVMSINGLFSFGQANMDNIKESSPDWLEFYNAGDKEGFDKAAFEALPYMPSKARWALNQGLWSFYEESPYEYIKKTQLFDLTDVAKLIKTPLFIASAENEGFFPGQADKLRDALNPGLATLHLFETIDGAGEHDEVGANFLKNQVAFDWFQDIISKKNAGGDCVATGNGYKA